MSAENPLMMQLVQAAGGAGAGRIADVVLPIALEGPFSYRIPHDMSLEAGDVVRVPFGPREAAGVIWNLRAGNGDNLKVISSRVSTPPLSQELRKLVEWVAWYTLVPRGQALALVLRAPEPDAAPERPRLAYRLAGPAPQRMTAGRLRVLESVANGLAQPKSALMHQAGVSGAVIDGLVDEGTLDVVQLGPDAMAVPNPEFAPPVLSDDQSAAAKTLRETVREKTFSVTLLEGVTGSGKTEVYFEAAAEALKQGRQTLILMPEIALTAQFTDRFESRFGVLPALWHSGVSARKRERIHAGAASGEASVVAGARSALYLPFAQLGLVIVDEEHETAYKQDDGVAYHARDMAVVRGRLESAAVILASATPSLESRVNAAKGRYRHLKLPNRHGGRDLPHLSAVDLRKSAPPRGRWISPPLEAAIRETVEAGEQALIFLNRRGYAPLTLCKTCGHRFQCPNCSAWLVDHRFRRALVCHHCGHIERRPTLCTACGADDSLVACGPGVERLAEEAATLFPGARMIVLSSDFPGGTERLKHELGEVAAGNFDVVIGTQLVAKGHNFPGMTLVGVVDADIGLTSGDPRAAERTFQILQQVTGRAGRGQRPGRALIQSHDPSHPVLKALLSGDPEQFYAAETKSREAAGLPPFGRLASIVVTSTDKSAAETLARDMARLADAPADVVVLGPAEPPISLLRGRYRVRLIVKAARDVDLQAYLRGWMSRSPKLKGNLRVQIDVDPQSFL